MSTPEVKENKQGAKRFGIMNLIGAVLGCGLILAGIITIGVMYAHLPTANGRDTSTPLPMEGIGIDIEDVQVRWQKADNERVALRAAIHPVAKIRLADSTKDGQLILQFVNSSDARVSDLMHIDIANGKFEHRDSDAIKAAGNELTVILESGFMGTDEYKLHTLNKHESMWKLIIQQRDPETGNRLHIGHACVQFMEEN